MAFAFGRATPSLRQAPLMCLDNPVLGNIIFSLNGEHHLLLKVLHFRVDKRTDFMPLYMFKNAASLSGQELIGFPSLGSAINPEISSISCHEHSLSTIGTTVMFFLIDRVIALFNSFIQFLELRKLELNRSNIMSADSISASISSSNLLPGNIFLSCHPVSRFSFLSKAKCSSMLLRNSSSL